MDVIVPILVQLFTGAVGNAIGQITQRLSLETVGNCLVGAVGGVAATLAVSMVPGLVSLIDATPGAPGVVNNIDLGALAGQAAVGLIGGAVLTALAGAVKSAMVKA